MKLEELTTVYWFSGCPCIEFMKTNDEIFNYKHFYESKWTIYYRGDITLDETRR